MKPGRNAPCHCGSGLKYKKCCLLDNRFKNSTDSSISKPLLSPNSELDLPENEKISYRITLIAKKIAEELGYKLDANFVSAVALGWNLSILDESPSGRSAMQKFLSNRPDREEHSQDQAIFSLTADLRDRDFPEDSRLVVDFDLQGTEENLRLSVACFPPSGIRGLETTATS